MPSGPLHVHTTCGTCSLTGPSSVWIGGLTFSVSTFTLQPGTFAYSTLVIPLGNSMSSFVTCAPSCSPGTRAYSVANAPAGTVLGWMLMCACAAAGASRAVAASVTAIVLNLISFLLWGWGA